jgi:hypothetical protein
MPATSDPSDPRIDHWLREQPARVELASGGEIDGA